MSASFAQRPRYRLLQGIVLWLALALPAAAERIVAGLSQTEISINANFSGSEIIIYGAVKRDAPAPQSPAMEVIVTVEGPSSPLIIRKKERRMGIWLNKKEVQVDVAPSFYAVATTGKITEILTDSENLRYQITIPSAIRATDLADRTRNSANFIAALLRIREAEGRYRVDEGAVELTEGTLFRADVVLPANLTEGDYRVRMYITRGGMVIDSQDQVIVVQKQGLERFVHRLSKSQPLIYGLLSLLMAVAAGWGASSAFRLLRT